MPAEHAIMTEPRVLRPHRHLLASGLIAALALTTPVFAVAYWLTIGSGRWPVIVAVHVLVAVIALLLVLRYRRTLVTVSPEGIRERGFLGPSAEIANVEIGSLCLVEICRDNTPDTQPNLFVLDRQGVARMRLRGQYWSRADMEAIAEVLDRPLAGPSDAVTLSEMRSTRPEWLYWFERVSLLGWL